MTEGKTENQLIKVIQKTLNLFQLFLYRGQLSELETGEDVGIMLGKCNLLEGDDDLSTFKEALKIIGRKDISTRLEIYLAAGK